MKILTTANAKIQKGTKFGYLTFGIHLAPARLSGYQVCPMASAGCSAACLNTAGRGQFNAVQVSRIAKTQWFFQNRPEFLAQLVKEIGAAVRQATKKGLVAVFRLNLTSDLQWENIVVQDGKNIFQLFPGSQFYDYTAIPKRAIAFSKGELPANYHLTFSRKEDNGAVAEMVSGLGVNVAAVFKNMPETFYGRPVVDADETDLRFLDGKGVVCALKAKGKARKDTSGFVI
jgi:hypothetical protein